jgi:hypothetical protein
MTDIKALLAQAKLPQRSVPICLRGDLHAEWEDLQRQLTEGRRRAEAADSLGEVFDAGPLAERIGAVEQAMADATLTLHLRALPQQSRDPKVTTWDRLLRQHPVPEDGADERDRNMGVNTATFFPALIQTCCVEPDLDPEDWDQLFAAITDGQYTVLCNTAWTLNRGDVDIPFSFAASRIRATSGGASKPPNGSDSL